MIGHAETCGALIDSTSFDPWGVITATAGSGFGVGFQGDVTSGVSGDVWMGARWYSPSTASFTSRDSIDDNGRFGFGGGDPLGRWDPDGRMSISVGGLEWVRAGRSDLGRAVDARVALAVQAERAVIDQVEAERRAELELAAQRELQRVEELVVSCFAKNALVGDVEGSLRADCGSLFSELMASDVGGVDKDQVALGILGAYSDLVDRGKHRNDKGHKADGKFGKDDLNALIKAKNTPDGLVWALKRIMKDDDLRKQVINFDPSCGAFEWAYQQVAGEGCEFSWKKTAVDVAAFALAVACPVTAGATCAVAATFAAGAVGSFGYDMVGVSDGYKDFDWSDSLTNAAIGGGTALLTGGVLKSAGKAFSPVTSRIAASPVGQRITNSRIAQHLTRNPATEAGSGGIGPVLKGEAGVQRSIAAAEARGETVLGREITMETSAGRTRPDLLVRDVEGNLKFIESKCGPSACLTPNQKAGYPLIESQGGIPRGGNAANAGLTPGEPIGPTPVQVDWWDR